MTADMVGPTRDRHRDLLTPAPDANTLGRTASSTRYTSSALWGENVLLIDDTWTTGHHAQSAAAALKAAGAERGGRSARTSPQHVLRRSGGTRATGTAAPILLGRLRPQAVGSRAGMRPRRTTRRPVHEREVGAAVRHVGTLRSPDGADGRVVSAELSGRAASDVQLPPMGKTVLEDRIRFARRQGSTTSV